MITLPSLVIGKANMMGIMRRKMKIHEVQYNHGRTILEMVKFECGVQTISYVFP